MRVAVIIPAAGASTRYSQALDAPRSKLDEDLGGKPVLQRTVELFSRLELPDASIAPIIVAGPHDDAAFNEFRTRHADRLGLLGATLCRGGKTHRFETVRNALALVPEDCTHVAVHDAARPCTPPELLDAVFAAAARADAVIPAVDCRDTLKRTRSADAAPDADPLAAILGAPAAPRTRREVTRTIDRAGVVLVQTPQVFTADLLRRAYADLPAEATAHGAPITDDASLVERLGVPVVVVAGDERNIKITTPADLRLARAILGVSGPHERPVHKRF